MSIPCAAHRHFIVSANEKARLLKKCSALHLSEPWFNRVEFNTWFKHQCSWWPSSTNASTATSGRGQWKIYTELKYGKWAYVLACNTSYFATGHCPANLFGPEYNKQTMVYVVPTTQYPIRSMLTASDAGMVPNHDSNRQSLILLSICGSYCLWILVHCCTFQFHTDS